MIDVQKEFYDLYKKYSFRFIADSIEFDFKEEIINTINSFSIHYEVLQKNKFIRINRTELDFNIFYSEKDFLKISVLKSLKDTLILNYNGQPFSFIDGDSYLNFKKITDLYLIQNALAYVDFIDFLKSKDVEIETAFHFIDYFNKDLRKIVLTSLSEKGRIIIKYENDIPLFDASLNYGLFVDEFKNCFTEDNNHLPKFLKNSLIENSSRFTSEQRMKLIFENLDNIISSAKINFEIYLNNLSIDQIKKEYDDYKSKYFNELSDILSKLTHKIIGLPIGISAILFALFKIKDEKAFLIVLVVILTITSIYLTLLLRLNFKDLVYISKTFKTDYDMLRNNNFFSKYPEELKSFEDIKNRISDRIGFLKIIVESYFWILNISNILIIGFILHYFNLGFDRILIPLIIVIILLLWVRSYIFEKETNG